MAMNPSDSDLVIRCRGGDEEAFRLLVQKYQRPIYFLAWKMLSNEDDARDLTQETFVKAFRALDSFDEKRSFSAWINRIAINLAYDMLRKRRHQMVSIHEDPTNPDHRPPELVDRRPLPDAQLQMTRGRERVEQLCQRLPPPYRSVIHLRYIQQRSYDEIARILELPLNTVKARLFRAHRMIQGWLEGSAVPEPEAAEER